MDKAFKKLSVILIVINCLVTFQLFGMPKFYTNKHHFFGIFPHRPYIYVCSPLNDMTLKDDKGNDKQFQRLNKPVYYKKPQSPKDEKKPESPDDFKTYEKLDEGYQYKLKI